MNPQIKYRCPICLNRHDSEVLAENCCVRKAKIIYVCSECNEDFLGEGAAKSCCLDKVNARLKAMEETRCLCGKTLSASEIRDSKLVGSVMRCRDCLKQVGLAA